jgi:hypothetical protein
VVDLDPHTWRVIGDFFDPAQYIRVAQPGEHGLFVLHDGGRVLRVVDTTTGVRRDLALSDVADPPELADKLFATGEWERVHIIDKRHLSHVANKAQESPRRELTLDQYYHLVYSLLWDGSDGYVSVPPHPGAWHGWTYAELQGFIALLPDPATVALVVVGSSGTDIGLILDLRGGLIHTVTTLETFGLPAPTFDLTEGDFKRLWAMLQARSEDGGAPRPAAALLCSRHIFDLVLDAPDKAAKRDIVQKGREEGEALLRVQLGNEK